MKKNRDEVPHDDWFDIYMRETGRSRMKRDKDYWPGIVTIFLILLFVAAIWITIP